MEYLQQKWRMWYNSLDVNHDGKISLEDVEESRKKFTDLHELLGDKAEGVKVDMANWWNEYIFLTGPGKEISEAEFVTCLQDAYTKDKAAFIQRMEKCFNMIFDVIDTNKDRSIELKEFILAFKAFGHENEALLTKAFGFFELPIGEEVVPLRAIVAAWVKFVTSDDSSQAQNDVVKKAFDAGW